VALEHRTVDRYLLAGADTQPVAGNDVFEGDVFLGAVVAD
jgi:hypothetical protein